MEFHEYASHYPELAGDEYIAFRDDIKANGQRETIKYRRLSNGSDQGLDGRNRLKACIELGIKPALERVDMPDNAVRSYIDSLNLHRRHLTREFRQQRVATMRACGQSEREIAETLGVSKTTVHRDLEDVSTGPKGPVDPKNNGENHTRSESQIKIVGKDGKVRDAKKPPKLCERCQRIGAAVKDCQSCKDLKKPKAKPPLAEREPGIDPPEIDENFKPIPEKAQKAFELAKEIVATCRAIDDIVGRVGELSKAFGGRMIHEVSIRQQLQSARKALFGSRAVHVCPYCSGATADCKCCIGEGWVDQATFATSPFGKGAKKHGAK